MTDRTPHDDPDTRISEEHERARALAEVLRSQTEHAEASRHAEMHRERLRKVRRGVLLCAWVGVAYVWIGAPSWLDVEPPAEPTVQQESRALRVNVFLQSQRIEAYFQQRGRLPYVLEEAGPPFPGMEYHRRDNRFYELRGRSERVFLRYMSEEPALDFVGSAADILDQSSGGTRSVEGPQ